MFTSRANPNDWIFLPAAGYKTGTSIIDDGWSLLVFDRASFRVQQRVLFYFIDNNNYVNVTSDQRAFGFLIRPVLEE